MLHNGRRRIACGVCGTGKFTARSSTLHGAYQPREVAVSRPGSVAVKYLVHRAPIHLAFERRSCRKLDGVEARKGPGLQLDPIF